MGENKKMWLIRKTKDMLSENAERNRWIPQQHLVNLLKKQYSIFGNKLHMRLTSEYR